MILLLDDGHRKWRVAKVSRPIPELTGILSFQDYDEAFLAKLPKKRERFTN